MYVYNPLSVGVRHTNDICMRNICMYIYIGPIYAFPTVNLTVTHAHAHAHAHAIFIQPAKGPPATLSGSRQEALHPNYYTHHLFWMIELLSCVLPFFQVVWKGGFWVKFCAVMKANHDFITKLTHRHMWFFNKVHLLNVTNPNIALLNCYNSSNSASWSPVWTIKR
jgi:hypothetical protein